MVAMASDAPEACAFCDIAAGRAPATIVASDALTLSFFDLRQFHPGHVLVVPRAHIARPAGGQEVPHLHFHVHPRRLDDDLLRVYPTAPAHPDRGTLDQWGIRLRTALAALVGVAVALLGAVPATAQPQRFEAGVQVVAAPLPDFQGSDFGIGGRLGWRANAALSFDGELNLFPGEYPDTVPFTRRRVEGLFGLTVGRRFGTVRPFGTFRAGFLDVQEAPGPVVCILIFPPPLSCTLAAGRTLPAFHLGGGVDVDVTPRTFIRVEAGDRMLKYPESTGHVLRFAAGAGLRF